jgi:hypothetical protein
MWRAPSWSRDEIAALAPFVEAETEGLLWAQKACLWKERFGIGRSAANLRAQYLRLRDSLQSPREDDEVRGLTVALTNVRVSEGSEIPTSHV